MIFEKVKQKEIILGSKSPRRHMLLKGIGLDFKVMVTDVEEQWPDHLKGQEIAIYLSELKAKSFLKDEMNDNTLIITADTIVWINDHILNKPIDFNDAVNIISELSGNKHQVYTGVTLRTKFKLKSFFACSDVTFKKLSLDEIKWYIEKYQPFDKAGAYGAQEWIGYIAIEKIEGSYFNVMGLPTHKLYEELCEFV